MPIASAQLAQAASGFVYDDTARRLIALLSGGGDARITLDPVTGLNKYLSAPYPRDVTAFASSTANDISADAFAFLRAQGVPDDYGTALDAMRARIRAAYGLAKDVGKGLNRDEVFEFIVQVLKYGADSSVEFRLYEHLDGAYGEKPREQGERPPCLIQFHAPDCRCGGEGGER